jgi:hypothetical protein
LPFIQITPRSPMQFDPADLRRFVERNKIHSNGNGA